jgi:hypothetical protein
MLARRRNASELALSQSCRCRRDGALRATPAGSAARLLPAAGEAPALPLKACLLVESDVVLGRLLGEGTTRVRVSRLGTL